MASGTTDMGGPTKDWVYRAVLAGVLKRHDHICRALEEDIVNATFKFINDANLLLPIKIWKDGILEDEC